MSDSRVRHRSRIVNTKLHDLMTPEQAAVDIYWQQHIAPTITIEMLYPWIAAPLARMRDASLPVIERIRAAQAIWASGLDDHRLAPTDEIADALDGVFWDAEIDLVVGEEPDASEQGVQFVPTTGDEKQSWGAGVLQRVRRELRELALVEQPFWKRIL